MIDLSSVGIYQAIRELERVSGALRQASQQQTALGGAVDRVGRAWEAEARRLAPGRLAGRIHWRMDSSTSGYLQVSAIAWFVDQGTKGHPIAPRDKDALSFWWAREGRHFRGRPGQAVWHPEKEGVHFLARALHSPAVDRALASLPTTVAIDRQ